MYSGGIDGGVRTELSSGIQRMYTEIDGNVFQPSRQEQDSMHYQKILVVDDEQNIIEVVCLYLKQEGFAVSIATDGEIALATVRTCHPDLIILDLQLPRMNGLDVLRALQHENSTPVIILTARGQEVDRVVGLELGADDYIAKPFSPRELVARVKAVLRRTHQDAPYPAGEPIRVDHLMI